jgi:sugar/nucleoside kinase (ribokinase family)
VGKVVGLGQTVVDLRCFVETIPELDGTVYTERSNTEVGGMVAIALATLAKLGIRAELTSAIGDDHFGEFAVEQLQAVGVDCTNVQTVNGGVTAYSFVMVDAEARRTIVHDRGVQRTGYSLKLPSLTGCRILHLDGNWFSDALKIAHEAKKKGITITIDISAHDTNPRLPEFFALADFVVVPDRFATAYTGIDDQVAAARAMFTNDSQVAVLTRGEHGALIVTPKDSQKVPGFSVKAVDTTGAGDSFRGGFIYGLYQGFSLHDSVVFANAVAAIKCSRMGGIEALPTLNEVEEFLRERGIRCGNLKLA